MPPSLRPVSETSVFPSERLDRIFRYWQSKSAGRLAPCREDIMPTELHGDLPWVWLADEIDDGAFR